MAANAGVERQCPGTDTSAQSPSSKAGSTKRWWRSPSATAARHVPFRSITRARSLRSGTVSPGRRRKLRLLRQRSAKPPSPPRPRAFARWRAASARFRSLWPPHLRRVRSVLRTCGSDGASMTRPGTLGELRESGWVSRPVKEEVRENAIARVSAGQPLVDGIVGFEDTVLPQLENALIAGHDVIFLGERGQAKTRIIRSLTEPARRVVADRRRQRDQRRPVRADLAARPPPRGRARRRDPDRVDPRATGASARSWRRPTRRSPTSSARSTRSRSPRAATSPTS